MSILQGGGGFPFLSDAVYDYLSNGDVFGISVRTEDVSDATLHFVVEKVCVCVFHCFYIGVYRNSPTIRPPFLSSSSRFKRGVGVYPGTCANTSVIRPPYVAV